MMTNDDDRWFDAREPEAARVAREREAQLARVLLMTRAERAEWLRERREASR